MPLRRFRFRSSSLTRVLRSLDPVKTGARAEPGRSTWPAARYADTVRVHSGVPTFVAHEVKSTGTPTNRISSAPLSHDALAVRAHGHFVAAGLDQTRDVGLVALGIRSFRGERVACAAAAVVVEQPAILGRRAVRGQS